MSGRKTTWGLFQFSRSENGTVPFRNREVIPRPPSKYVHPKAKVAAGGSLRQIAKHLPLHRFRILAVFFRRLQTRSARTIRSSPVSGRASSTAPRAGRSLEMTRRRDRAPIIAKPTHAATVRQPDLRAGGFRSAGIPGRCSRAADACLSSPDTETWPLGAARSGIRVLEEGQHAYLPEPLSF
jgi:hypothetical protein